MRGRERRHEHAGAGSGERNVLRVDVQTRGVRQEPGFECGDVAKKEVLLACGSEE